MTDRILRTDQVVALTGLSRTTIWRLERKGKGSFPPRIRITGNLTGWRESDINAWIEARPLADQEAA